MISFLLSYKLSERTFEVISSPEGLIEMNAEGKTLQLWGDPINHKEFKLTSDTDEKQVLEKMIGHFYYILHDKKNGTYSIGNSVFGLLPVYYCFTDKAVYISDAPVSIADQLGSVSISKRFVLENVLFNYPLFNHSCFNGIELLPVNSCIQLKNSDHGIKEILRIEDHFVNEPIPWRKSADHISNVFLERVKYYLPDEEYFTSLTGGFDGRTLTAASLYHKKKFSTYSFGSSGSKDVEIAKELSKAAGIEYQQIDLNSDYIQGKSFENGKSFITTSNGTASFSRAHYLYAATELKKRTRYIITGNFGSELFRAAHVSGVLISNNLKNLFSAPNFEDALKVIENSSEWGGLNRKEFEKEWNELVSDIKQLPCFNDKYKQLTKNQQFYVVIFNEVIRKYFGAEMVSQYNLIINRTPFLDLAFMKELFKTELAGVYSDLFTNHPLKRFKGQVAYAYIIKKAFPLYGTMITDKGYKPNDLLNTLGKVSIFFSYIRKRVMRSRSLRPDPYVVAAAFECNRAAWRKEIEAHSFFNNDFINDGLEKGYRNRDSFFITLSQLWWINYLKKRYAK